MARLSITVFLISIATLNPSFLASQSIIDSKVKETNPYYFDFSSDSRLFQELKNARQQRMNNGESFWEEVSHEEGLANGNNFVVINKLNSLFSDQLYLLRSKKNKDNVAGYVETSKIRYTFSDYKIEEFYDNTISNLFEVSSPIKKYTNEKLLINVPDFNINFNVISGYKFEVVWEGTPVDNYVGYYKTADTIRNRKGGIRRIQEGPKTWFNIRVPTSKEKIVNNSEVNGFKIGRGFFRAYAKSSLDRYIESETWETYTNNLDFTISNFSNVFFDIEDADSPKEFYQKIIFLSAMLYNVFIFPDQDEEEFIYTSLPDSVIALAEGMNDNCNVKLLIDTQRWNESSGLEKYFILFHELGHDIFNLSHNDGIRLMATSKFNIDSDEEFGEMIHEMLFHVVSNYDAVGVDATAFDCN